MKYSCNACGAYVEAGGGHSCYTSNRSPLSVSQTSGLYKQLDELEDTVKLYETIIDTKTKAISLLRAELLKEVEFCTASGDLERATNLLELLIYNKELTND